MKYAIEIENLTKYYGKSKGIEGVSFNVAPQEIYGFIGPNGAGKSTTIRTLLNLIFPTSGSAKIFGQDVVQHGHLLRKDIGYLPSEVFYYEKMKVKELLAYAASFYECDHSKRIEELVTLLELDVNRRIEDLSFGNKKKVGIVVGLLHRPKLIILDEPTSGLDPLMQHTFFNLIKQENENGATVLFSSHILSEVQHLCHKVAIIKDGHIVDVQDIKAFRENTYKKITLISDAKSKDIIGSLDVADIRQYDHTLSFVYRGELDQLLKTLSSVHIQDIKIEEPSLEEVFMHYYEK